MHRSGSVTSMRRSSSRADSVGGTRPYSRASWKTFSDDGADIAAAMDSVKRVMKSKSMAREASDLQVRIEEANRRMIQEAEESEAREAERRARREKEQEKAAVALEAAMQKGNLKALQKAIDCAVALGVSLALIGEARALWNFESQLQAAVAAANLDMLRKVVADVERARALASFPREPPFVLHQPLQYWSEKKGDWVDCHVADVSTEGKIQINLKKKASHWYSHSEQLEKFRITDADVAAVAPMVCIDDARVVLDKAHALEHALLSENVDNIKIAVARAGQDRTLAPLIHRAEAFIQEAVKAGAEAEAARRSSVAAAWHAAKKNIRIALRAAADSACSEAGSTGWDDLEQDLLIERLDALEKAFDSTDLDSLELALKQLASEDIEVPLAVIDEAGSALLDLRRQHEELEEAIRDGDIGTMSAAIELASEHFLPEVLVCKARSVLDMAIALQRAIKSRDPSLLASTLSQVGRDFPCISLVQHGCSIVHATKELQDAMRNNDIDAVRVAIDLVEEHLLPEVLVRNARLAISLDTAIASQDSALLASTLARVGHQSNDMPLVQRAKTILAAIEALQASMQKGDMGAIQEAIRVAEAEGVEAQKVSVLSSAHGIRRASVTLDAALHGDRDDAILEAMKVAKAQGVPTVFMNKAQQRLERRASDAVQAAVLRGDIDAIEEAIQNAEVLSLPEALLDKFRQDLAEQKVKRATNAVQAAKQCGDIDAMEEAIRVAETQSLPEAVIRKFRQELKEQKLQRAADAVQAALKGGDVNAIEEAIRLAEDQGVSEMLLSKFRQELAEQKAERATQAVQAFMQGSDLNAIDNAIRVAEAEGVPGTIIDQFQQQLAEKRVQRAIEDVQVAMRGSDVDAIEEAIRVAEAQGVSATVLDKFRRELEEARERKKEQQRREKFLADLQVVMKGDSIPAMRQAIAEGEALGLAYELEPARKALEEELSRRMAKALEERAKMEKLAAEFKNAKEAQDFGGGVLVAQWRAAVAEVAKPFAFSEEDH